MDEDILDFDLDSVIDNVNNNMSRVNLSEQEVNDILGLPMEIDNGNYINYNSGIFFIEDQQNPNPPQPQPPQDSTPSTEANPPSSLTEQDEESEDLGSGMLTPYSQVMGDHYRSFAYNRLDYGEFTPDNSQPDESMQGMDFDNNVPQDYFGTVYFFSNFYLRFERDSNLKI